MNNSNRNLINLSITPQSDYSSIELTCIAEDYTCSNLAKSFNSCETILSFKVILGCNYRCYFVTKKFNYIDTFSNWYSLELCEY